jgi:hypothetical protein
VRMRSLLVTLPAVVLALFNLANLVGPKGDPLVFTPVVCCALWAWSPPVAMDAQAVGSVL